MTSLSVGTCRVYDQVPACECWNAGKLDAQLCEFKNVCLEMSLSSGVSTAASPQKHRHTPAGGTGLGYADTLIWRWHQT